MGRKSSLLLKDAQAPWGNRGMDGPHTAPAIMGHMAARVINAMKTITQVVMTTMGVTMKQRPEHRELPWGRQRGGIFKERA